MSEFIYGMPENEYHARPELSKHGLDLIARSPLHFQANAQPERTPAMVIGSATHHAVLEPDLFAKRYAVAPEGIDRRTNAGKALWQEFVEQSEGLEILTAADAANIGAMREAVMLHPAARALIAAAGTVETVALYEIGCVAMRSRFDKITDDGRILIDLKTAQDASPQAFARDVARYRYHVQAALYSDAAEIVSGQLPEFAFLVVEKTAPHAVAVYTLDAAALDRGRELYRRDIETWRRCNEAGRWPSYSEGVATLSLPRWALYDNEVGEL